jgi:NADPH:quinone reductase-like Zn-dependent oxidoreductase
VKGVLAVGTGLGLTIGVHDVTDPSEPEGLDVIVEVRAAGIALPDLLLIDGAYPGVERADRHPVGIEFAGVVADIGDGVTRFSVGDRVCGMVYPPQGAASERLVIAEGDLGRTPSRLTDIQAAALPSAFMTAHCVLFRQGAVRPGERVLVLAGASGLGLACIQLARAAGAEVYAAASAGKLEALEGMGVARALDYAEEGWHESLPELDVIVDPLGGDSFALSYSLLRAGGRLVCLDAITRHPEPGGTDFRREPGDIRFDPIEMLIAAKSVIGVNMPALWEVDGGQGALMEQACGHVERWTIEPVVAATFAIDDVHSAIDYVRQRRNIGRVVLTL